MTSVFKTVALVGKYHSPEIAEPLSRLVEFITRRGLQVVVGRFGDDPPGPAGCRAVPVEEIGAEAELAVVLGGDGTMLRVARAVAPHDIALIGINQGRLGFLTDISLTTMFDTLGAVLDGEYVTEARMVLAGEVERGGKHVMDGLAFNDIVVSKGGGGGMIEFEVRIDGKFLYALRGDGLIVTTPTGSTAYALSSGGPIVHPALSAITLVPICPHTFSSRPIVIGGDSTVEIILQRGVDARAHFDSHRHRVLDEHDCVRVRRYPRAVRLLHPAGHDYYNMLRAKLHWTELY